MSKTAAHILILEDDPDVAFAAEMLLRRRFARVQVLHDPARLDAVLAQGVPDLILLDFNFAHRRRAGAGTAGPLAQPAAEPGHDRHDRLCRCATGGGSLEARRWRFHYQTMG